MITRTCPACGHEFKRCKKVGPTRTCVECAVELYYDGAETVLLSIRTAQVKAADSVVGVLESHISKRDGLNFKFEGACRAKELKLAYSLIERADGFLSRQIDIGISALEFCIEIIEEVLSDKFWANVTQSIAMFMKYVSDFAKSVFLKHKDGIEQRARDDNLSSLVDFLDYSDGGDDCYQVATT